MFVIVRKECGICFEIFLHGCYFLLGYIFCEIIKNNLFYKKKYFFIPVETRFIASNLIEIDDKIKPDKSHLIEIVDKIKPDKSRLIEIDDKIRRDKSRLYGDGYILRRY